MQSWRDASRNTVRGNSLKRWPLALCFVTIALGSLPGCSLFATRNEIPLKQATLQELTNLLVQRQAAMHSLKGLFSAKITGGILPIGQRVEGAVFYRQPDAIRL